MAAHGQVASVSFSCEQFPACHLPAWLPGKTLALSPHQGPCCGHPEPKWHLLSAPTFTLDCWTCPSSPHHGTQSGLTPPGPFCFKVKVGGGESGLGQSNPSCLAGFDFGCLVPGSTDRATVLIWKVFQKLAGKGIQAEYF